MYRLLSTLFMMLTCATCFASRSLPAHRLTELKRDLSCAQNELTKAQLRVQKLEEAIANQEIVRIENEIHRIEAEAIAKLLKSSETRHSFFSDEREILAAIIHDHPGCATRAQSVMDEILTLITHISDGFVD